MTRAVPGGADPDMTAADYCAAEPIHTPGSIQPHGVLIATAPGKRCISHVSGNIGASLGLKPSAVLGADIACVLGGDADAVIAEALTGGASPLGNVLKLILPIPLNPQRKVLIHRHEERLLVELEAVPPDEVSGIAVSRAQGIVTGLRRAETLAQLCDELAPQFRELTGFDRVMIYRLDHDFHGAVIAEAKAACLAPYINLHYPATDIPIQARRLYEQQRLRGIADVSAQPVPVMSADGTTLDMSFCALRAVSPAHVEYLSNMGVRASLSVSLLHNGKLWGLIACHHSTPRAPSPELRALCDMVGQFVSLLIARVLDSEVLTGRLGRSGHILRLQESIDSAASLTLGLARESAALMTMMESAGVLVRYGGDIGLFGQAPPEETALRIVDGMLAQHPDTVSADSNAGLDGGPAAGCAADASGVCVLPLGDDPGDVIAWFRPEITRVVSWGGDPRKAIRQDPGDPGPSPRKSFAAWRELQRGHSAVWTEADRQTAMDLRRMLTYARLRLSEKRLAHLAVFDPLTGLPNRRSIEAELQRWQHDDPAQDAALLFIDIDRFKSINDRLGHAIGDECLTQVAARLRQHAPSGSLCGRFGGDEFVVFWPGATRAAAEQLADILVESYRQPFTLAGKPYFTGVSVGVVFAAPTESGSMICSADAAMYGAKRKGGGRSGLFRPELHSAALHELETEQDLFQALESGTLEVHYQPLVRVADRRISGFEALARWRHPVHGWISPTQFIPLAERSGLIAKCSKQVLDVAIARIAAWRRISPALTMSVNISVMDMANPALLQSLAHLLRESGVPPEALCLEVTESRLMEPDDRAALRAMRAMGVHIAIDDFGTGYSSLAYLREAPANTVKIDQSFVSPLGAAEPDRFFGAIVDIAQAVGLHTVAEGCETPEQWQVIEASGCETVQGYLVAAPMDEVAAELFLRDGSRWRGPSDLPSLRGGGRLLA